MSIRSELEGTLLTWAAAQSPPLLVCVEGVPFVKPTNAPYLQVWLTSSVTTNPTVDGKRKRVRGFVSVNICVPDGKGSKQAEDLAQQIVDLFPVVPKSLFTTVSIEQTPQTGQAMIDNAFRVIPVTIRYRQES